MDKINHKILGKSENLLSKLINEEYTYAIHEFKDLRNENPYRIIIGHINEKLVRNKLGSQVKYANNNIDKLMVSETKNTWESSF